MRELALFGGGAGGILGCQLVGFHTVCAVENDPSCIETILLRQKDGCLPRFPVWDDVRTFDGRPWRGSVDVITGGFPCQDIAAPGKGRGITGSRSRLFFEMLRIIEDIRPRFVLAENAKELRTKGLGAVLTGLARLGYDARWGVLGARHVGANHWRKRMWIVAADSHRGWKRVQRVDAKVACSSKTHGLVERSSYSTFIGEKPGNMPGGDEKEITGVKGAAIGCNEERDTPHPDSSTLRKQPGRGSGSDGKEASITRITDWWDIPRFARVDDGGSNRMDIEKAFAKMEMDGVAEKPRDRNARILMTGNMQVPAVAATAWKILSQDIGAR